MSRCDPRRRCLAPRGFAFLWTLLLVAFLALGVTIGVEMQATLAQRERERELLSIGRQFRAAIARYHDAPSATGQPEFPATLDDLLLDTRSGAARRHLRKVFVDPMTGRAEWGLVRIGDRIAGVHSLSEREPIKQDGFDADEPGFRGRRKVSEWVFAYTGRPQSPQAASAAPPN